MHSSARISGPWFWFFLCITLVITVTMMVPALFGLQNVTQWGGMYVDGWCNAYLYDSAPNVLPARQSKYVTAGTTGTVYSVPMFNQDMCFLWSRKFCGKKLQDGWTVTWVDPYYRQKYFLQPENACEMLVPSADNHWYRYAP